MYQKKHPAQNIAHGAKHTHKEVASALIAIRLFLLYCLPTLRNWRKENFNGYGTFNERPPRPLHSRKRDRPLQASSFHTRVACAADRDFWEVSSFAQRDQPKDDPQRTAGFDGSARLQRRRLP